MTCDLELGGGLESGNVEHERERVTPAKTRRKENQANKELIMTIEISGSQKGIWMLHLGRFKFRGP